MKKRYKNIADIQDLDELIERAYDVFGVYTPHRPLEVCTYCCMCPKNVSQIYKTPVRQLSREIIYDYLGAAQGETLALSDEIRYFAPRIFELLAKGEEYIRHSTEYTLDKFHVQTGVWLSSEVTLFERFSELFLTAHFTKTSDEFYYIEIFDYIVMFYLSGLNNTKALLSLILMYLDNEPLLLNLCAEVYYWFKGDYYGNPSSVPSLNALIYDWEHEPVHRKLLIDKLLQFTQSQYYEQLDGEKRYWVDHTFDRLTS